MITRTSVTRPANTMQSYTELDAVVANISGPPELVRRESLGRLVQS